MGKASRATRHPSPSANAKGTPAAPSPRQTASLSSLIGYTQATNNGYTQATIATCHPTPSSEAAYSFAPTANVASRWIVSYFRRFLATFSRALNNSSVMVVSNAAASLVVPRS